MTTTDQGDWFTQPTTTAQLASMLTDLANPCPRVLTLAHKGVIMTQVECDVDRGADTTDPRYPYRVALSVVGQRDRELTQHAAEYARLCVGYLAPYCAHRATADDDGFTHGPCQQCDHPARLAYLSEEQ